MKKYLERMHKNTTAALRIGGYSQFKPGQMLAGIILPKGQPAGKQKMFAAIWEMNIILTGIKM